MSASASVCPKCGTALPSTATEGLCPRCLFAQLDVPVPAAGAECQAEAEDSESGAAMAAGGNDREFGDYELFEEIGQGGMGVVYRARQVSLNRPVAIKVIKLGMDTRSVMARFEAERQALALMDHPGIARVFDAGATQRGRPYFVMELVEGARITNYCTEHKLSTNKRLDLFIQVCHAVQHAHQKGIIHRDLKPSNILITELDGRPLPKVIDFGIAKAIEGRLTEETLFTVTGQFIGTPAYLSPEQAEYGGEDIDTRSDIYSLGVLLYELLTGCLPFEPKTLAKAGFEEMRRTIREVTPVRPSTRLKRTQSAEARRHPVQWPMAHGPWHIDPDLDWIVMKCLEKDRARRYETANGLAMDMMRHLNSEPIVARPPSRLYEFQKSVRRHKVGFGAMAVVILALAAGLAGVLWQWRRAAAAERQALHERSRAELLAAESALKLGQSKLEAGDSWGLLDLVEAYGLAEEHPAFQEAVGRRWATWHAEWDRRTIGIRRSYGIPSPDRLQTMTLTDWPPLNTSREVNIVDTLTGARCAGPLMHKSNAKGGAFSPDGRRVATVTEEGVIRLWDRRSGQPVRPPCETGIPELNRLLFSENGRFLVAFSLRKAGSRSNEAAFLCLDQPEDPVGLLEHRYPVGDAQFSPDGEFLAVLCTPDLQLWRTDDLQPVGPSLPVTRGGLLEFNADGSRLAINPATLGGIGLLDPQTQQIVQSWSAGSGKAITGSFSHDGRLLATFGFDLDLSLWRTTASAGEPYAEKNIGVRLYGRLSFNRDDSLLAVGDAAGTIHVLSTSDGHTIQTLHAFPYAGPHFLTNGILAASGGNSAFWDLEVSPLPGSVLPHDALAYSLALDRFGTMLAVGSEDELRLWKMQSSPHLARVIPMPGRVLALTFLEAEDQFVAFSNDGSLTQVEPRTGAKKLIRHIDRGHELSACLSPDSRKLVLFRDNETVVVDTTTGALQWPDDDSGVLSVAFRGDSEKMAAGMENWKVGLYDMSDETPSRVGRAKEIAGGGLEGVAYHPSGRLLAVCVGGHSIRLYDPDHNRPVFGWYKPSLARVNLLCFSPDGSLLATAGPKSDGGHGVELWHVDVQRGLYRGASILPCGHRVWSMAFNPDNRTLVTGGLGTTRLWHLPPAPKNLGEVQSRTWATLGFRLDEQGNQVFLDPPTNNVEEIRTRLTQETAPSDTPLDAALKLSPAKALIALQALAEEHPGAAVYRELQGRRHASLMTANAMQGRWNEALAHANEAIRLGYDNPGMQFYRALLRLQAGDVQAYRADCQAMLQRYESCDDPAVIRFVAAAATLRAGVLDDHPALVEHVRRSVSLVGGADGPGFRFYLGAVLFRAGRFAEAVTELEQVDRHLEAEGANVNLSPIYHKFLLATCHAHLRHEDAAHKWFDAATRDLQSRFQPDQATAPVPWWHRLVLALLQKDAEAALSTLAH